MPKDKTKTTTSQAVLVIPITQVFVGILNQSGTDVPTVNVLQNSLDGDIAWTRSEAGVYRGTLAGAFPEGKTFVTVSTTDVNNIVRGSVYSPDSVEVNTAYIDMYTKNLTLTDDRTFQTFLKIEVYQ